MDIFPIRLRLQTPIPMSSGVIASTGNVLVRLSTDDRTQGWGEGVEAQTLTGQTQASIVSDLEALRGLVVGSDPRQINEIWTRIKSARPSASTALGAIDIAVHDLVGKIYGLPIHALIGGAVRDRIPALTLVGSGDTDADLLRLKEKRDLGYSWFKLKVGMAPREVEWHTIDQAISLVGADGVVCADANEAWDEETAQRFLESLEGMPVKFLEQPVPRQDRARLLRIAERSPIPICADESAIDLASVIGFTGTSIGGVSLKLIKHGGVTGVMRGGAICSAGGLGVNLAGKVIESSISAAANLHCAAALEQIDFGCSPANLGAIADVTASPISVDRGEFSVPDGPGLGIEVDEALVRQLAG
jgi:muconate cycloisomerase